METWEIILAAFIFLLFVTGIIVGIYFLYKNSKKKEPDNGNGNGNRNGAGLTTLLPPDNTINNTNNGVPYAYSQTSSVRSGVWYVPDVNSGGIIVTPAVSSIQCNNYLFSLNTNDQLVWQGDGNSIVTARPSEVPNDQVGISSLNSVINNPDIISTWVYNESQKTWCSNIQRNVYCL